MNYEFGMVGVLKHVTHAVLAAMLAAAVWLTVCANALPAETLLLACCVLYGVGWIVALGAVFFTPELPRLRREKGRTPLHNEAWVMLLFALIDGVLLFLAACSLLVDGEPVTYTAATAPLTVLATCIAVANERMCICWNEEGFVLRTALGNVHHFQWAQLTGHHTYRGTTSLHVDGRYYTANLRREQIPLFLRASAARR